MRVAIARRAHPQALEKPLVGEDLPPFSHVFRGRDRTLCVSKLLYWYVLRNVPGNGGRRILCSISGRVNPEIF
jgi:hypothetical protein